ncbi:CYTH and CHAD domain-containing protein [Amnibacterium kyonggiense]|uniref:CHAD domain-containing protein n=1 Tax=Amnibacterium kyonggiense TaxID=595671 RepID=A0A4R7FLQ8_9MICO|nr:CYTH and CHAD domain-containing protein [Amnibacterium kyonggiense]TDS77323.1 CHAD domain-containing protein [Amnibacterium kyonggiense]
MSVSRAIEVERKYAVPDGVALPSFERVPGVVSVERRAGVHLDAVYVDTEDRALLGAGIVVRRRTGGHDEGWHMKLRGTTGRVELHAPIDPAATDRLPDAFAAALRSRVRGRPLAPIALIRTERRAVVLVDRDGDGVEVVDDLVSATDVAAGVLRTWREWEAEQAEDTPVCEALLDRVDGTLRTAGATDSASPAKIAQALGLVGSRRSEAPPRTAGAVVVALVAGHVEELHRGLQSLVLDDDPDGTTVHGLRKTVRRARSVLAIEGVTGPAGRALRQRLGDLGRLLGELRDPLIAARTAAGLLDELPAGTPGLDAARALLVDEPAAGLDDRTAALVDRLAGEDVLDLLADLERFDPDGPLVDERPKALRPFAEAAVRRARKRSRRGVRGDLDALHRARKAAKRARFTVEELVAAGVVPGKSTLVRSAKRDERAQDVLGEHRDLALLLDALPAASERLTAAGDNAFALGLIAAAGQRRLARLHRAAERAVRRLDRP